MKVKKFQAVDMQEALKLVKAELGPHAVIIQTRKIVKDKTMFGLFGRPIIEVTAAVEGNAIPAKGGSYSRPSSQSPAASAPSRRIMQEAELPPRPEPRSQGGQAQQQTYAAMGQSQQAESFRDESPKGSASTFSNLAVVNNMITPLQDDVSELKDILEGITKNQNGSDENKVHNQAMETNLDDIKVMLEKLMKLSTTEKDRKELPPALGAFYERMLKNGLDDRVAIKLVQKANDSVEGELKNKESYLEAYLGNFISKLVKVGGGVDLVPGMAKVVSFVGATGVGKTTTIAKIAAKYKLKEKKKVVLITIDTFRIAAVEQLKIYANILGLPVEVVMTPNELRDKIDEYSHFDLILIDTAGRSQRESGQLVELKAFLDVTENMETHLLLSTTSNMQVLTETIDKFKQVGFDKLIFTKLDEGGQFGQILNLTIKTQKPLSFFTVGQRVPEDIEVASSERVADLILNR